MTMCQDCARYMLTLADEEPCLSCLYHDDKPNFKRKGEVEMENCELCVFSSAPDTSTVCSVCLRAGGTLPNYKPKAGKVAFDEARIDVIGPNGNEGLHYDNVQKPKHYQLLPGVEVIDVRRALLAKVDQMPVRPSGFAVNCWDRALEYTIRAWEKNGVEDLEKAVTYLQHAIKELKG